MKNTIVLIAGLALACAAAAQVDPTRPMLTGRGNVNARPDKSIVTNATSDTTTTPPAAKSDQPVELVRFEVTGSLLPHAPAKTPGVK